MHDEDNYFTILCRGKSFFARMNDTRDEFQRVDEFRAWQRMVNTNKSELSDLDTGITIRYDPQIPTEYEYDLDGNLVK